MKGTPLLAKKCGGKAVLLASAGKAPAGSGNNRGAGLGRPSTASNKGSSGEEAIAEAVAASKLGLAPAGAILKLPVPLLLPLLLPLANRFLQRTQLQPAGAGPRGFGEGGAGGHRGVLWFRNDLRLHDHRALDEAMKKCATILAVFCFDPREYNGQWTGPYKCRFAQEAVRALRKKLRRLNSDLVIRLGKPEDVLPQLCTQANATAVFCHSETARRDRDVEEAVRKRLPERCVLKSYGGAATLHHLDSDGASASASASASPSPSPAPSLPSFGGKAGGSKGLANGGEKCSNFSSFSARMREEDVKRPLRTPSKLRPFPQVSGIRRGAVPSLKDLGIKKPTQKLNLPDGRITKGGEDAALQYVPPTLPPSLPGKKLFFALRS